MRAITKAKCTHTHTQWCGLNFINKEERTKGYVVAIYNMRIEK